jgi:hypothetical protein
VRIKQLRGTVASCRILHCWWFSLTLTFGTCFCCSGNGPCEPQVCLVSYQPLTPQWLMRIADVAADIPAYQYQNLTKHSSRIHAVDLIVARRCTWIISLIYRKIPACSFVLLLTRIYALSKEALNQLLKGPPSILNRRGVLGSNPVHLPPFCFF